MPNREDIEKVRQEIMRLRELLTIMRGRLDQGERAYDALFSGFSPEERAGIKEKDLQWKLAETLVGDTSSLMKAVLHMWFAARELERSFEELHDIIATVEEPDAD